MTRSFFLFVLAALALAPALQAQTVFGVRAGLNVATFTETDFFDFDARLGFVGGAFARVPVGGPLTLQPEVLYSQEGARLDFAGVDYSVDYLEIPLLARLAVPLVDLLDTGVFVGPAIGIAVADDIELDEGTTEESLDPQTDFGIVAGADVGAGPFSVDLRYTFGLRDVLAESDGPNEDTLDFRNGVFSVTAAYVFGR